MTLTLLSLRGHFSRNAYWGLPTKQSSIRDRDCFPHGTPARQSSRHAPRNDTFNYKNINPAVSCGVCFLAPWHRELDTIKKFDRPLKHLLAIESIGMNKRFILIINPINELGLGIKQPPLLR